MKLRGGLIRSILAGGGAALIALCSLATNLQLFDNWIEFSLAFVGNDHVSKFEERVEPVKQELPRQGVAGYISDLPDHVEEYYLMQYSLAPLLLEPNQSHKFVVSMYREAPAGTGPNEPARYTERDLGHGIKLLDFGNGIKLFRNENK